MFKNSLSYFPEGYDPRPAQIKLVNDIEKGFETHKFVICEAPTGTGKSLIAKTFANMTSDIDHELESSIMSYDAYNRDNQEWCMDKPSHGCFTTTVTKTLQDSYKTLFEDAAIIKGKSNHLCAIKPGYDVEVGPCCTNQRIKKQCWDGNVCPYYVARNEGLVNKFTVLNYSMLFAIPYHLRKRQLYVLDEASELPEELVKRNELVIPIKSLSKQGVKDITLLPSESISKVAVEWLNDVKDSVSTAYSKASSELTQDQSSSGVKTASQKKRSEAISKNVKSLKRLLEKISLVISNYSIAEYVIQHGTDKSNEVTIIFTPLKSDPFGDSVFRHAEKVLLMSATIIDHKTFARSLGIKDYAYVSVDSDFNPKKSPIIPVSSIRLVHKNMNRDFPKIVNKIIEICEYHKVDKGIIHTHSMDNLHRIKHKLTGDRYLYRFNNTSNEDILEEHLGRPDPTVLISPSMSYGIDLAGDAAKFCILCKAPWLPIGDKRIDKLRKIDPEWYVNRMLSTVIQASGRGVRSIDDECVTYILDASIIDAVTSPKNKWKIPKFFLDRLRIINT